MASILNTNMTPQQKAEYMRNFQIQRRDHMKYKILNRIGKGTFGEVFRAEDMTNRRNIIAMKKISMDKKTKEFPLTALREIKILKGLDHENIVRLIDVVSLPSTLDSSGDFRSSFYLALEFCEHDLSGLLSNKNIQFSPGEIKKLLKQLFEGLFYLHLNKILHRDLKPANVLITKKGVLKIADFGLSRPFSAITEGKKNRYTNRVVTLWYRPPELLLGERNYGTAVDMWGVGCIMAEMWTRYALMPGRSEQVQLEMISELCGSITPEVWPDVVNLELYNRVELPKNRRRRIVQAMVPYIKDESARQLLDKLLQLNPENRINAEAALDHDYFWTGVEPCDLTSAMSRIHKSMLNYLTPMYRNEPKKVQIEMEGEYADRNY